MWMDTIVAEHGVMVKHNTLSLFCTSVSSIEGQIIGLIQNSNGTNFFDTTLKATSPTALYQIRNNYVGLSTPSLILIGDPIYLVTNVSQNIFGSYWMQVSLHQFKSYSDITKW